MHLSAEYDESCGGANLLKGRDLSAGLVSGSRRGFHDHVLGAQGTPAQGPFQGSQDFQSPRKEKETLGVENFESRATGTQEAGEEACVVILRAFAPEAKLGQS